MAPRKKKDKNEKDTAADGEALILEYLKKQNRPYSALDVSTNLHGKVTKTYAVKALKELHERKQIEARVAGKQIVYHALQETDSNGLVDSQGSDLVQANKDLEEKISTLKVREKQLRDELATFNAVIPIPLLKEQIAALENKKSLLVSQIAELSAQAEKASVHISQEDVDRIDREWRESRERAASRKRIFLEFWDRCTEALPEEMTPHDLRETLGLEGSF